MAALTREQVIAIVAEARARGVRPDLSGLDLSGLDLSGLDLSGSDLRWSILRGSNLRESNLRGSILSGSDLRESNLRESDLRESNLRGSILSGSDLRESNLRESDLSWSVLSGSNLSGAHTDGILTIPTGLPSGPLEVVPTSEGWSIRLECWRGASGDDLREVARNYPSGCSAEERARRRPVLLALADLIDAHIASLPDVIPALAKRWGAE